MVLSAHVPCITITLTISALSMMLRYKKKFRLQRLRNLFSVFHRMFGQLRQRISTHFPNTHSHKCETRILRVHQTGCFPLCSAGRAVRCLLHWSEALSGDNEANFVSQKTKTILKGHAALKTPCPLDGGVFREGPLPPMGNERLAFRNNSK